ncbi:hypothetical protein D9M72_512660 [compost metagenome]
MHGNRLHPGVFGALGNQRRVDRVFVPAEPHLQRHRHFDGIDCRLNQRQRVIGIAHECRAGVATRHLLGRASHVDVDDIGTIVCSYLGGFRHPMGLTAGKLNDMRFDAGVLEPRPRFRRVADQLAARNHLGHDKAGAIAPCKPPERQIGNAGHGGERNAIAEFDSPDPERRRKSRNWQMHIFQAHVVPALFLDIVLRLAKRFRRLAQNSRLTAPRVSQDALRSL